MKVWVSLAAGAALMAATPSSAAVYILTVKGNLQTNPGLNADQIDRHGFFGAPGQLMAGQAFVARWRIDTRAGWEVTPPPPGSTTTLIRSGQNPFFGFGDAFIGSFTMAGVTIRDIGLPSNPYDVPNGIGSQSQMALSDNSFGDQIAINSGSSFNTPGTVLVVNGKPLATGSVRMNAGFATRTGPNLFTPGVFFNSFDLSADAGDLTGGFNGQFSISGSGLATTYYFNASTISMAPAIVPEPGTWAMLIIGFGLVGTSLRQRRRASAHA